MIIERLKDVTDSIIKLERTIGYKIVVKYVFLILFIIGIFNIKSIMKSSIEFINEINTEIHDEKMEKRDQLLSELLPVLKEYRASVGADRLLYFEYHNSKENLVGIPFKYVDLILQDTRYGTPTAFESNFRDINVGAITTLYEDIKLGDIIYCNGINDENFLVKYRGAFDIFHRKNDNITKQAFISLPGISQPVGLIVLEWIDKEPCSIDETNIHRNSCQFRPRINAMIMSKK